MRPGSTIHSSRSIGRVLSNVASSPRRARNGGGKPALALEHNDAGGYLWWKAHGLAEIAVERHEHAALVPAHLVDALVFGSAHLLLGDGHDVVTFSLQQ
jgi:hypothetical protein